MTLERLIVKSSTAVALLRGAALPTLYGVNTGRRVRVGLRCVIRGGTHIRLGDGVVLTDDTWLNVVGGALPPPGAEAAAPEFVIEIGEQVGLGRRAVISAAARISIGPNTIFGPNVLVTDHNHEWSKADVPVRDQGISDPRPVHIGAGCWIGANSILLPGVQLPDNCVVAANSVVTERSLAIAGPTPRLVGGAPARVLR